MELILSGSVFTVCDDGGEGGYQKVQKIKVETEFSDECLQLFSFKVAIRDWQNLSDTDRFVKVDVPKITDEIIKKGVVVIYLNEFGKHVSLPFTYYQLKQALSFQPSYELGTAYVNILGNFISVANSEYTFKLLIVTPKGLSRYKKTNLYNYEELRFILGG